MKTWTIPVTWEVCGLVKVQARSIDEALEIVEDGYTVKLPDDSNYVDGSFCASFDDMKLVRELYNNNQEDEEPLLTKRELEQELQAGRTLEDIFVFRPGQECEIFKAKEFIHGNEILYIPDVYLNDIDISSPIPEDQISEVLDKCYTGDDFVRLCNGTDIVPEQLFAAVDWQHPSSALPELEAEEEDELCFLGAKESPSSMTNKELNTKLYERIFAEHEAFKKSLLAKTPEEILDRCYEYQVKSDILITLEIYSLSDDEAAALLNADAPLEALYQAVEGSGCDPLEAVLKQIRAKANDFINEKEKRA